MSGRQEIQSLLRVLRKEGAIITLGKSGHYKVKHPDTRRSVHISATPKGSRTVNNEVARLRRIGFLTSWKRDIAQTTRRESALAR